MSLRVELLQGDRRPDQGQKRPEDMPHYRPVH